MMCVCHVLLVYHVFPYLLNLFVHMFRFQYYYDLETIEKCEKTLFTHHVLLLTVPGMGRTKILRSLVGDCDRGWTSGTYPKNSTSIIGMGQVIPDRGSYSRQSEEPRNPYPLDTFFLHT